MFRGLPTYAIFWCEGIVEFFTLQCTSKRLLT